MPVPSSVSRLLFTDKATDAWSTKRRICLAVRMDRHVNFHFFPCNFWLSSLTLFCQRFVQKNVGIAPEKNRSDEDSLHDSKIGRVVPRALRLNRGSTAIARPVIIYLILHLGICWKWLHCLTHYRPWGHFKLLSILSNWINIWMWKIRP